MSALTDKIRAQFPGVYDDIPDAELEQKVLAKYPQYADLSAPAAPAATPAPSGFRAPITLPFGRAGLKVTPESLTEWLPAAGATAGSFAPAPGLGTAGGAAAGEALRQLIRKSQGEPPATGFVQQATGLDPNSPEAMAAGVAAEAGGARLAQFIGSLAPGLRNRAIKWFVDIMNPRSLKEEQALMARLAPIAKDLPVGTLAHIQGAAEPAAKAAGEAVGSVYASQAPISVLPAVSDLRDQALREVLRPAKKAVVKLPWPQAGTKTVVTPPELLDEKFYGALRERMKDLLRRERAKPSLSIEDVFKMRKEAGNAAKQAKAAIFEGGILKARPTGGSRALKAEQAALSDILHAAVPGGAKADAIYSAWKTVADKTQGKDASVIPLRWFLSRMIPGTKGIAAGYIASKPAFWASYGSKALMRAARMLEAGNETGAIQLMRGALDAFGETPEGQEQ